MPSEPNEPFVGVFAPPFGFAEGARVRLVDDYEALYRRSLDDPQGFWHEQARHLSWFKPPSTILRWDPPHASWFEGATTNIAYNCLDRHLISSKRNQAALIWESEDGEQRTLTYHQLWRETCRLSNALISLGVNPGERVGIYMGLGPEAVIAMLACARMGAVHSVVFGGFTADALRDRVNDAQAKLIITQDGFYRRGQWVALKHQVDHALPECPQVEKVIVFKRGVADVHLGPKDLDWNEVMGSASQHHQAAMLDAEHPLFILYTSGTTGKPKGVVHTTGGYMVGTHLTSRLIFDLRDDDVYWCTADIGWITGHSYVVYGPLLNGATVLLYEGAPNYPDAGRLWSMVERHGVSVFYTAPTAIRALMKEGDSFPNRHNLKSLRLLGTVGEPINPKAWLWYRKVIGGERCPIVDTWWQTETGAIMISPMPGITHTKPGSCAKPFLGISATILREDGTEAAPNEAGYLVIDKPWPSMARTLWGNDERYRAAYFSKFAGKYLTGDGARKDDDGYFWVTGRIDDVVNVAGHRLGTAEIEHVLVSHPAVAEAAVVTRPDDVTGEALVAFVTLKSDHKPSKSLRQAIIDHVGEHIGKFARPTSLRFADNLPKTRSGKIMRRLLRELAAGGEAKGDMTTLEDISVLAKLSAADDE